jgi:hypothetical protein
MWWLILDQFICRILMGHKNWLNRTLSAYKWQILICWFLLEQASRLIPVSVWLLLDEIEASSLSFFLH